MKSAGEARERIKEPNKKDINAMMRTVERRYASGATSPALVERAGAVGAGEDEPFGSVNGVGGS